jgi:hypothetical protein
MSDSVGLALSYYHPPPSLPYCLRLEATDGKTAWSVQPQPEHLSKNPFEGTIRAFPSMCLAAPNQECPADAPGPRFLRFRQGPLIAHVLPRSLLRIGGRKGSLERCDAAPVGIWQLLHTQRLRE